MFVTRKPPGPALELLRTGTDVRVWPEDRAIPRQDLEEALDGVAGLFTMLTERIDEPLLARAPNLRVISTMAVGTDNIDLAACTAAGIPVGHTPGVLADTVADLAIGLLLAAGRRIVEGVDYVQGGRWAAWEPDLLLGRDLHGSTVGIIGLGGVGAGIARRLVGFGCRVVAHNRTRRVEAEAELGVEAMDMESLLTVADHVIVAVALTPETHHLIDEAALRRMKPSATLVNVSRGGTVDPSALAFALENGLIAAAALDVTEPEPIDAADPLLRLANCIVIPHLGSSTVRTRAAMAEMAARNLLLGLEGEPMEACANPEVHLR